MAEITLYNHVERALNRLPDYYDDKPLAKALIETLLSELNEIENAADQLRRNFTIQNAEGVNLDIIGSLFNVLRNGRDDEEYRKAILNQTILFFADGTISSIIEVTNVLTGRDDCVHVDHENSLHFVQIKGGFDADTSSFLDRNAAVNGTRLRVAVETGQTMLARSRSQEQLVVDTGEGLSATTESGTTGISVSSTESTWQMPICWII
jgi:hypothetical protein